jgi:DNA helicase-2/ATP-dependent DNA helicase PcrA
MTTDIQTALNSEQQAVVEAGDGPILVLAAAGTGKTRTLVYRVARLVDAGVDPGRVLLLTFTNKAAREMLERATSLVGNGVSGLWGGTFHHMANRLLRRHSNLVGFQPDFSIMDRDDSKTLVRNILKDRKINTREFPKPDILLSVASAAINMSKPVSDVAIGRFGDHQVDVEDVCRIVDDYTDRKVQLGAMDFDDLLAKGLQLFKENPDVLVRYQEQFLHVLVDEYQDTNSIQAEWVDLVSGMHRNLLVVGDDFQSIYSWRGADFRNIISFPERYPDAQVFKLETNYRSVPEILEVANACIAANPGQFEKSLKATREPYDKPVLARLQDGRHQAHYIIHEIMKLRRSGYAHRDIAVLYRAHFHAMELQLELTRSGIPYVITSGVRFFEQAHIKDVCAMLKLISNPADELSFSRLLEMFPKVGPATARKIWVKLQYKFQSSDPAARQLVHASMPPAVREKWEPINKIFEDYWNDGLADRFGVVISRFMKVFYDQHAIETYEDYDRRVEDIQELILYTERFPVLDDFLSEVALMSNLDAEAETTDDMDQDAVRLSTVHQAKGLEFPVVFGLWLTEGMFPSNRSLEESPEGDQEERRLFYVMVTRAMDELFLCVPRTRFMRDGGTVFYDPSRFVTDIPDGLARVQHVKYL